MLTAQKISDVFASIWCCFGLEHRKILPYAKSDRHQRSLWSRLAADEVREDSQHDQLSACTVRALRAYFL